MPTPNPSRKREGSQAAPAPTPPACGRGSEAQRAAGEPSRSEVGLAPVPHIAPCRIAPPVIGKPLAIGPLGAVAVDLSPLAQFAPGATVACTTTFVMHGSLHDPHRSASVREDQPGMARGEDGRVAIGRV